VPKAILQLAHACFDGIGPVSCVNVIEGFAFVGLVDVDGAGRNAVPSWRRRNGGIPAAATRALRGRSYSSATIQQRSFQRAHEKPA